MYLWFMPYVLSYQNSYLIVQISQVFIFKWFSLLCWLNVEEHKISDLWESFMGAYL